MVSLSLSSADVRSADVAAPRSLTLWEAALHKRSFPAVVLREKKERKTTLSNLLVNYPSHPLIVH